MDLWAGSLAKWCVLGKSLLQQGEQGPKEHLYVQCTHLNTEKHVHAYTLTQGIQNTFSRKLSRTMT